MSRLVEFETQVLSGLPVLAKCRVYPPEPDIGIFHPWTELEQLCWKTGTALPDGVFDRIKHAELERIEREAAEQCD